jgi:uncharacterized membrane protein YeaQ/YmgE (transglycosylase-associated protein family)
MEKKRLLLAGIIGGGAGGLIGAWLGNEYGKSLGYNPYIIALFTGICSITGAVIMSKILRRQKPKK